MAFHAGTGEAGESAEEDLSSSGAWSALPHVVTGGSVTHANIHTAFQDGQAAQIEHLQAWATRMSDLVIYLSHGVNNLAARVDEMDQRLQAAVARSEHDQQVPIASEPNNAETISTSLQHIRVHDEAEEMSCLEATAEEDALTSPQDTNRRDVSDTHEMFTLTAEEEPLMLPVLTTDSMSRAGPFARRGQMVGGTIADVDDQSNPAIVQSALGPQQSWSSPRSWVKLGEPQEAGSSSSRPVRRLGSMVPSIVNEAGLEFALKAVQDLRTQLVNDRGAAAAAAAAAAAVAATAASQAEPRQQASVGPGLAVAEAQAAHGLQESVWPGLDVGEPLEQRIVL